MKSIEVVAALGALAQESRLTIFRELVKRGPDGYTPGDLISKLEIPAPTLSFHLKELLRAQLVSSRRDGRFLYYSANFDTMQGLIGWGVEDPAAVEGTEARRREAFSKAFRNSKRESRFSPAFR
jgi:ArsR family transcriptional regulator, arsenate/arsenite/antimonite-responsive transcriptional repressor